MGYTSEHASNELRKSAGGPTDPDKKKKKKVYGKKVGSTVKSGRTGKNITVTDKRVPKRDVRAKF